MNAVRWPLSHVQFCAVIFQLVQYDLSRAGVRIRTYREGNDTISKFLIERAMPSDSGEYFCDPDGLHQVKVTVHILNGKRRDMGWELYPVITTPVSILFRWLSNSDQCWRLDHCANLARIVELGTGPTAIPSKSALNPASCTWKVKCSGSFGSNMAGILTQLPTQWCTDLYNFLTRLIVPLNPIPDGL